MTITVPSDIVADVMNAADPANHQAALARLASRPAAAEQAARIGFASQTAEVARSRAPASVAPDTPTAAVAPGTFRPSQAGGPVAVYRKFEGFVLQVLIETMLPNEATLYGKGTAGTVWRSMLAEQLGDQLASSGGIGIARVLAKAHPEGGQPLEPAGGATTGST